MPEPQAQPDVSPAAAPAPLAGPATGAASSPIHRGSLRGESFAVQTLRLRPARSTPRLLSPDRVERALSWYGRHSALYPRHVVGRIQREVGATADGVLGPQTVQHIAVWQAGHALAVDGIAGPVTVTALFGRDIRRDPPEQPRTAPGGGGGSASPVLTNAQVESALAWYHSHRSLYPPEVAKRIQRKVDAAADGIIGPKTVRAVARWQRDHGLTVDGIAGPRTLQAMFGEDIRPGGPSGGDNADTGLKRPDGYSQIVKVFGEPGTDIVTRSMPAGAGGAVVAVRCHKKVAGLFEAALKDIRNDGLSQHIHTYDGCYVYRRKRGSSSWSTHAWGIAMDLNALTNPMTGVDNMTISKSQKKIAPYFERYGFYWGKNFGDPMHFQYCTGY